MDASGRTDDPGAGALAGATLRELVVYVSDPDASRAFYEGVLGMRPAPAGPGGAAYDAGPVRIRLRRADDEAVTLPGRDPSADLTFLVPALDPVRDALAARGVAFGETMRYVIGATAGFDDPDGHHISLYEPSAAAMTWPSGDKIRAVLRAGGKDPSAYGAPAAPDAGASAGGLAGSELVYLFLFVPDADRAMDFYHGALGLPFLECRPCRRGSTEHERGVVKYDAGGTMLTTHLWEPHGDGDDAAAPTSAQMKAVAPVFEVDDVGRVAKALAAGGVSTGRVVPGPDGPSARFEDPFGRVFHLVQRGAGGSPPRAGGRAAELAAAR